MEKQQTLKNALIGARLLIDYISSLQRDDITLIKPDSLKELMVELEPLKTYSNTAFDIYLYCAAARTHHENSEFREYYKIILGIIDLGSNL